MKFSPSVIAFIVWSARQQPIRAFAAHPAKSVTSHHRRHRRQQQEQQLQFQSALYHHSLDSNKQCPNCLSGASSLSLFPRGGGQCMATTWSSSSSSSPSSALSTTTVTTTTLNSAVADTATDDTCTTASAPVEIFRKDYEPLPYTVDTVELDFDIYHGKTIVQTKLKLARNPAQSDRPLVLDGDETSVKLIRMKMDGVELIRDVDYTMEPGKLTLLHPKDGAWLSTTVEIVPEDNLQLSGLYKSGSNMYCTQCEAMGFRRITYFPDRPDNMSTYAKVKITADASQFPVLLSNGNLIEQGKVPNDDSRHYAIWSDPFPKPSYLFAAVAGNLASIQDSYSTKSGKTVKLQIFSEPESVHKLEYAMNALKRSMKWDEDRFGLEYDLGIYNIVATSDFNMGAMENKGLNIFNTAYVLADAKTATDVDFERVESVIGHEYFHNWTGNRVTCRDWFQLTLKEGLTVFRDQEFSSDMNSRAVKRIEDVKSLRGRQFNEDAGPMKHPIRPESYISMDNFYTATVYSKGAEVIRMYQTILGVTGFNKGMKLYFERHDGTGVTCDDFLAAMADANGVDLGQFALWYSTAGTPTVKYSSRYENGTFSLTLSQSSLSETPMHIPVSFGLLDKDTGKELVPTTVLELKENQQTFTFDGLEAAHVVPSILREFSAPVKLLSESGDVDEEESLAFLAARDTDGFNRWEAGQKLFSSLIFQTLANKVSDKTMEYVNEAFGRTLADIDTTDYSIQAYALDLPSESALAEDMEVIDPIGLHKARGAVKQALARKFQSELKARYDELTSALAEDKEFKVDATAIGRRRLRNVFLEYLCSIKETPEEQIAAAKLAMDHFQNAQGMTDKIAALSVLASMDGEGSAAREEALQTFYNDAAGDALVLNKWFTTQALSDLPNVLDRVKKLTKHADFTIKNPNRLRSLVSAFTMNSAAFHDESGAGYEFIGDMLRQVDEINPQISSRLAGCLIQWRRYDEARGKLMKDQLEKLAALKLSDDLFEVVNRGLKDN